MAEMDCIICSKKFANGKALGAHMRSHYASLPLPPKTTELPKLSPESHTESISSLFSLSANEGINHQKENSFKNSLVSYGLREKPKKSFRMVDPDFFDSVVLESESESTRRRSSNNKVSQEMVKEGFSQKPSSDESFSQVGMVSGSVFTEEDVALWLIMLSRGARRKKSSCDSVELSVTRKMHKCDKCKKIFRSSHGLGVHKTIVHKRIQRLSQIQENDESIREEIHECPVCGKRFNSANALGGHKRLHILVSKSGGENLVGYMGIDLNLPLSDAMKDDEGFDF